MRNETVRIALRLTANVPQLICGSSEAACRHINASTLPFHLTVLHRDIGLPELGVQRSTNTATPQLRTSVLHRTVRRQHDSLLGVRLESVR
jgi:hypothetical protein